MRLVLPPGAERVLRNGWFRLFVAIVLTAGHVSTTLSFAHERFGATGLNAAPATPPYFRDEKRDAYPTYGKRLIVSRWDSEHYEGLALRGYSQCPHRKLVADDLRGPICDAAFYPGYPALGWVVMKITHLPIDYAMWGISLAAAVAALFFVTDGAIADAIGVGGAYASLLAFNFFPPACYLTLIMTDSCTVAAFAAGFAALARRRYVLAALAIGFSGAMRISGVGAEAAFELALLTWCIQEPPKGPGRWRKWLGRAALAPLGGWGSILVSGYHWWRAGDPLLYVHGHVASFHHVGNPSVLMLISPVVIIHAMDAQLHDLVWAGALLLFMLVGHRAALHRFPLPTQVFAYAFTAFTYIISISGSLDLFYMQGLSRYVWVIVPMFLAVGACLKRHPTALLAWLFACSWHSRQVDLCYFLGDVGQYGMRKCNMTQWIDH